MQLGLAQVSIAQVSLALNAVSQHQNQELINMFLGIVRQGLARFMISHAPDERASHGRFRRWPPKNPAQLIDDRFDARG
jgi:hypothetical protein